LVAELVLIQPLDAPKIAFGSDHGTNLLSVNTEIEVALSLVQTRRR